MGKRIISNTHPSKNASVFHSNFDQKIDKKSSRNRYFGGPWSWTNFGTNFAPFWEDFGQDLASIGSHFGGLGPSWTTSWVHLGASWSVLVLLWTTKSKFWSILDQIWSIFDHFWTPIWPNSEDFGHNFIPYSDILINSLLPGPGGTRAAIK